MTGEVEFGPGNLRIVIERGPPSEAVSKAPPIPAGWIRIGTKIEEDLTVFVDQKIIDLPPK